MQVGDHLYGLSKLNMVFPQYTTLVHHPDGNLVAVIYMFPSSYEDKVKWGIPEERMSEEMFSFKMKAFNTPCLKGI